MAVSKLWVQLVIYWDKVYHFDAWHSSVAKPESTIVTYLCNMFQVPQNQHANGRLCIKYIQEWPHMTLIPIPDLVNVAQDGLYLHHSVFWFSINWIYYRKWTVVTNVVSGPRTVNPTYRTTIVKRHEYILSDVWRNFNHERYIILMETIMS